MTRIDAGKKSNAAKKQARITNPKDSRSPKNRKPLTVIHGADSATVNPENTPEKQNVTPPTVLSAGNTPRSTPMKPKSGEKGGSNLTPKKASPVKVSPSTLTTGAATPYTPASVKVEEVENDGNFEYSFEEIRAGFGLPQMTIKKALQFQAASPTF